MKKTITIHQPDFLPWLGFFQRWAASDLFIVLDDVQFIRRGWHHRDKIKTADGAKWLTVPVKKKGRYYQRIREVETDPSTAWPLEHLSKIRSAYRYAPRFENIFHEIEEIYMQRHGKLIDLNMDFLTWVAGKLGIETPVRYASALSSPKKGGDKLIDLVTSEGGTAYMTGMGSKAYLEEDKFETCNIKLLWHAFKTPAYPQLHNGFIPNLSVLDALMMMPTEAITQIISGGQDRC